MFQFLKKKKDAVKISMMTQAESDYFSTVQQRNEAKDTKQKIRVLEKQLKTLGAFTNGCIATDGELPPIIQCRDELPELYKRKGQWSEAERVIKTCIACNAYYPENGEDELKMLLDYQTAAETVIAFLTVNEGYPQKNIYKALKDKNLNDYCLKSFVRNSELIKKVPSNGTNELYVK